MLASWFGYRILNPAANPTVRHAHRYAVSGPDLTRPTDDRAVGPTADCIAPVQVCERAQCFKPGADRGELLSARRQPKLNRSLQSHTQTLEPLRHPLLCIPDFLLDARQPGPHMHLLMQDARYRILPGKQLTQPGKPVPVSSKLITRRGRELCLVPGQPELQLGHAPSHGIKATVGREVLNDSEPLGEKLLGRFGQLVPDINQALVQLMPALSHKLSRRSGRCRPDVGNKIGNREVNFVADAADDRYGRGRDGTGNDFLVERPQVLNRASAPADNHYVYLGFRPKQTNCSGNLLGRAFSLDCDRTEQHLQTSPIPAQSRQDVVNHGPGRRGDNPQYAGQTRQRPLPFRCEQAFGGKPLPELFECLLKRTISLRFEFADNELVPTGRQIDVKSAVHQDRQTVFEFELEPAG